MLFERAMLWGLLDLQRNPIELIKLKGTSRRLGRPRIITPEKFQELIAILEEPYRTLVIVAICTGLRVSEVLALRWEIVVAKLGWHTFRHTYHSLLDEAGAPIGVQQKLMRHSNVATTMNVYGSSTLRAKQDANSKVVKMLIPDRDVA
jgi:integrase